jgi:predicted dienelactone hydrolase
MNTHLHLFCKALSVIALSAVVTPAFADTGLDVFQVPAAHQNHKIDTAVFFKSSGGSEMLLGENGVFYGVTVHENADVVPGKHPVILMSHGWGGNYKRMAWLSSALAEKGAIVIAVNHPNSTTGELNNLEALNHWTRAQDLTAALDFVMKDKDIAGHIDASRIYAVGFSYGGWTALSLGGLVGERDGLDAFCKDGAKISSHCTDILKAGIVISDLDAEKWHASYKEKRVAGVVAIDPALTMGLTKADTAGLDVPVMMIGLGDGDSRLLATDTSARGSNFEALLPVATVERIIPATHYTALGLCKPNGAEILKEENDDPVCTDPAGTDRKEVLDKIITLITKAFHLD